MNDQQVFSLIAVCALVMIPAGMALVLFHRTLRLWLSARLPPRHLKRVRVRRRTGGGKHDGG